MILLLLIPILVLLGIVELAVRGVLVLPLAFLVFIDDRNVRKFTNEFMNPYAMRMSTYLVVGKARPRVDPEYMRKLEARVFPELEP